MAKCLQMTSILHSRKRSLLAHNKVHPESYTSAREETGLVGMMQQQLDRQENKVSRIIEQTSLCTRKHETNK